MVDPDASMHMLSTKDLISVNMETVQVSKNPLTVITADGEVQTNEEATVYVKELDLLATVRFSKIRRHFSHLKSFAKITDISMIGPVVSYHISLKMAKGYNAIRKTTCRSLSQDYQPVLPVRLEVHLQHRYRRTQ